MISSTVIFEFRNSVDLTLWQGAPTVSYSNHGYTILILIDFHISCDESMRYLVTVVKMIKNKLFVLEYLKSRNIEHKEIIIPEIIPSNF